MTYLRKAKDMALIRFQHLLPAERQPRPGQLFKALVKCTLEGMNDHPPPPGEPKENQFYEIINTE